jgi:hypothetical protein
MKGFVRIETVFDDRSALDGSCKLTAQMYGPGWHARKTYSTHLESTVCLQKCFLIVPRSSRAWRLSVENSEQCDFVGTTIIQGQVMGFVLTAERYELYVYPAPSRLSCTT